MGTKGAKRAIADDVSGTMSDMVVYGFLGLLCAVFLICAVACLLILFLVALTSYTVATAATATAAGAGTLALAIGVGFRLTVSVRALLSSRLRSVRSSAIFRTRLCNSSFESAERFDGTSVRFAGGGVTAFRFVPVVAVVVAVAAGDDDANGL